jgi:hypothetical protein
MNRSAVLTLGGALLLGGASGVDADDLDASNAASSLSLAPPLYGVFSRVPENWSDLPVQLQVSQTVGYNSNILNTPLTTGGTTTNIYGAPVASLTSVSNFSGSTKAYWEGQQFFVDGSFGVYRYFSDDALNTLSHSFDIGDNWTYGSKCSGKLIGSEQTAPAQPGFQVGFNQLNVATTLSFNETATCRITGNYGFIFNSGATKLTNSASIDTVNDSESEFIAAGISYTVSDTNSLQFLTTVTGTNYTGRQGSTVEELNTIGLLNNITEDQLSLTYTKNLSHDLALTASVGLVGVRNGSFTLEPASGFEPVYSLAGTWRATPKLGLQASVSKTVSPPVSIIANLQVTESANLGLTYTITPKVEFAAGVQASSSTGGFGSLPSASAINPVLQPYSANQDVYSANASINYTITPFVTANLSYTHSRSVQANLVTPTDVVLLALTFSPH